jgi:hypothetical protein
MTPSGDSLTRKSVFDSYTLGCIPVIFAKATLSQYFWHLSEEEIEESTVYIPKVPAPAHIYIYIYIYIHSLTHSLTHLNIREH